MYKEKWLRFTWDLKKLPEFKSKFPRALKLEKVGPTELKEAWECVQLAYASDQRWSVGLDDTLEEMKSVIFKDPNGKHIQCLVLRDGGRIVAANVLFPVPGSYTQFFSGVCVIEEYQWRGVGATMLHESLKYLKEVGFEEVSAVTKENVIAGKYLYRKFGSKMEELSARPSIESLIRVEAEAVPAQADSTEKASV